VSYAGYNEPLDYAQPSHAPVRAREGLTEDDLRAIEARWSPDSTDIFRLTAEVRRLRAAFDYACNLAADVT
jgi:hypothetical protein